MHTSNVAHWEVSPLPQEGPLVGLEIDDLFLFRLTPAQAITLSAALSAAARVAEAGKP